MSSLQWLAAFAVLVVNALALTWVDAAPAIAKPEIKPAVTVVDNGGRWTLERRERGRS